MIDRFQYQKAVEKASAMLREAGLVITPAECERFEVADFGLNELEKTGLQIITYVNTDRCCAKEIIMTSGQTCPEHQHPTIGGVPGKEETFRCRWGTVYLYVPGTPSVSPRVFHPPGRSPITRSTGKSASSLASSTRSAPDTLHWFQAGPEGAIVSEFSTRSTDEADVFTDPRIKRAPEVA